MRSTVHRAAEQPCASWRNSTNLKIAMRLNRKLPHALNNNLDTEIHLIRTPNMIRNQLIYGLSRLAAMGWRARITLSDGLQATFRWFRDHEADLRQ